MALTKVDPYAVPLALFEKMETRRYRNTFITEDGKKDFSYELCPKGHGCDACMKKYTPTDTMVFGKPLFCLQEKLQDANEDLEYLYPFSVFSYTRCFSICGKCFENAKDLLDKMEEKLSKTSKHYKKYAPKRKGYGQLPLEKSVYF